MINSESFYSELTKQGVDFFTGVPDSLLKDFCAFVTDNAPKSRHLIASNEGASVGYAVGYHLATNKVPLVYLQNSGIGNCVNPLLSIADDKVYGIPMLLVVGWRGEPGVKDEPQHIRQGEVNEALLQAMQIPYAILDADSNYETIIKDGLYQAKHLSKPFVILVRKAAFEPYKLINEVKTDFEMDREAAVKVITDNMLETSITVSTTGKTSRELFEYRRELGQTHEKDFLTVGAMGHTSAIAMGIAIANENNDVYCIDGDGSALMHLGTLAVNGQLKNIMKFKHIVINNGAHDSVGGQPTVGFEVKLSELALNSGYDFVKTVSTRAELITAMDQLNKHLGRGLLEVLVNKGARKDLGRPTTTPKENKQNFMAYIKSLNA